MTERITCYILSLGNLGSADGRFFYTSGAAKQHRQTIGSDYAEHRVYKCEVSILEPIEEERSVTYPLKSQYQLMMLEGVSLSGVVLSILHKVKEVFGVDRSTLGDILTNLYEDTPLDESEQDKMIAFVKGQLQPAVAEGKIDLIETAWGAIYKLPKLPDSGVVKDKWGNSYTPKKGLELKAGYHVLCFCDPGMATCDEFQALLSELNGEEVDSSYCLDFIEWLLDYYPERVGVIAIQGTTNQIIAGTVKEGLQAQGYFTTDAALKPELWEGIFRVFNPMD